MDRRTLRIMLLVNGCVALATAAVTLLLLLIAPLGLAAVITITLLVALLTMLGGVLGDLVLWRLLLPSRPDRELGDGSSTGQLGAGTGGSLLGRGLGRLPDRRQR